MTIRGRVMSFFPFFHISIIILSSLALVKSPSAMTVGLLLAMIYLVPPLCFRIHGFIFGRKDRSLTKLTTQKYSVWWGGHQMQLIFIAVPSLEALLRIIPGVYSAWLRLWGSHVGKNVYWTPLIELTDRDLLDVGDHVILGHRAAFYAHVVKPKGDEMMLYTAKIKVGNGVFLGAGSRVGPGVVIADGTQLPILSDLYVNSKITTPTPELSQ